MSYLFTFCLLSKFVKVEDSLAVVNKFEEFKLTNEEIRKEKLIVDEVNKQTKQTKRIAVRASNHAKKKPEADVQSSKKEVDRAVLIGKGVTEEAKKARKNSDKVYKQPTMLQNDCL